jgi:mRNA interferase RelE/StbE
MGGGCLWDIGCYPVSYTRCLIGTEPLEVFAWQKLGASGVDEVFVGQMCFPGGIYAQFDCSFREPFRTSMEIIGNDAILTIPKKDLRKILKRIEELADNLRPSRCEKLTGQERYRIVYSIQDDELTVWVVKVGHRKDIYR